MSAKKANNKVTVIPNTIELSVEQKKWPEVKVLWKRIEMENKKKEIETKISPIIQFAEKTLGQEFKSFASLTKYVEGKTVSVVRAKRLTDEQKKKIDAMKSEKKTHPEIAAAVGCKVGQVNAHVYNKK